MWPRLRLKAALLRSCGHLELLSLRPGSLSHPRAAELVRLTLCRRLALSHNSFSTLPLRMSECARLRYLNVRYNALREFPPAVRGLKGHIEESLLSLGLDSTVADVGDSRCQQEQDQGDSRRSIEPHVAEGSCYPAEQDRAASRMPW